MKVFISLSKRPAEPVGLSPAMKKIRLLNTQRKQISQTIEQFEDKKAALKKALVENRKELKADSKNVSLGRKVEQAKATYQKLADSIKSAKKKLERIKMSMRKHSGTIAKVKLGKS